MKNYVLQRVQGQLRLIANLRELARPTCGDRLSYSKKDQASIATFECYILLCFLIGKAGSNQWIIKVAETTS